MATSRAELRELALDDEQDLQAAAQLFDGPIDNDATRRFLREQNDHLLLASVDGCPVGFITGVETTHPDKGTDMFVYKLSVDARFRRQGIGAAWSRDYARSRAAEAGMECG